MVYKERFDGRDYDETRPITAKTGVIPNADGSAMFKIGNTQAYAVVHGPREMHPRYMQDSRKGVLRCYYNMLPFSGHGSRVRPGGGRRAREIGMVTENALRKVVNLEAFPNSAIDVFIELPQTDAGTRCAGICAASMALADAGIEMTDLVGSIAVGHVHGTVLADLTYNEEANTTDEEAVADIPVAFIGNSGELTLLQLDGEISKEKLMEALKMGQKVCRKIIEVQKQALKGRYMGGESA